MSVKASISISEQQDRFARKLVEDGRYSSVSAVIQHGLEMLKSDVEAGETEILALKTLLASRMNGEFTSIEDGKSRTIAMIEKKQRANGI